MRETWVQPLGVITEPNQLGQYPAGALAYAHNCVMRKPGLLSGITLSTQLGAFGTFSNVGRKLITTGKQLVLFGEDATSWGVRFIKNDGTANTAPFADTALPYTFRSTGWFPSWTFRGRTLMGSDQGILVNDYVDPQDTTQATLRYAGIAQPGIMRLTGSSDPGEAVGTNEVVTYAATITRKFADGYELISEPSLFSRYQRSGAPTSVNARISIGTSDNMGRCNVQAGDILKLYRSQPLAVSGTGVYPDSGTTLFLTLTKTLTAADITAGYVDMKDVAPPSSLGEELYTNPGQESLQSIRRSPPMARTMAVYRGYTFYGNITQPAQWRTRVPGGMGYLSTDATRTKGIGRRAFTATRTSGSTTLTGISATEIKGLAVGQVVVGYGPITAVGATTVTVTTAPSTSGTQFEEADDVIEVDGRVLSVRNMQTFEANVWGYLGSFTGALPVPGPHPPYTMVSFETVAPENVTDHIVYNQGWALSPLRAPQGSLRIRASNGQNYDPPVPNMTVGTAPQVFEPTTNKNHLYWSWDQQPESVGPGNYTPVGGGEIYALAVAADTLWIFCSDGLYALTGYGVRSSGIGAQWDVRLVDATLTLAAPNAVCVLRDNVYAFTNRGLAVIGSGGSVVELTTGVIGDVVPGRWWKDTAAIFMASDQTYDEVWISFVQSSPTLTLTWIYSTRFKAFTHLGVGLDPGPVDAMTAMVWAPHLQGMALSRSTPTTGLHVHWFDPATTAGAVHHFDFQPVHEPSPVVAKQWIDYIPVFAYPGGVLDPEDPTTYFIVVTFNGNTVSTPTVAEVGQFLTPRPNDTRCVFGVPRIAPAIADTIRVGAIIRPPTGMPPLDLRGVSLRYEPLSEQMVFRGQRYPPAAAPPPRAMSYEPLRTVPR